MGHKAAQCPKGTARTGGGNVNKLERNGEEEGMNLGGGQEGTGREEENKEGETGYSDEGMTEVDDRGRLLSGPYEHFKTSIDAFLM